MSLFTTGHLTGVELDGIEWESATTDEPGGCDRFGWCHGHPAKWSPSYLGDMHSRLIATGWRKADSALIEISVGQWKANPNVGIRDTGSCFAVNLDRAPLVGIFTYPAVLDDVKRVALKIPDADALAEALRIVCHVQFADALDTAAKFARTITEETKR